MRTDPPDAQPTASVVARRLVIRGRVQGVGFRAATREAAARRGVVGWVRNQADGTVEAWLEGTVEDVEALVAWVSAGGPPGAHVAEVDDRHVAPVGHPRFEVRP